MSFFSIVMLVAAIVCIMFVKKAVYVVPQQHAFVVERLGQFHEILGPGLSIIIPFFDRVAYKHSLKEEVMDVDPQHCFCKDNVQILIDGVLYFQVTDPKRASYGAEDYVEAITQLAQTTLRSVIGKLELDKTFEEREKINHEVVAAIDASASNWGVKVLRYEIKDLTPPEEVLASMQKQLSAEREKRALIAASEGRRQEQINIAEGERAAAIARSEGEKQAAVNRAQGEAAAITAIADASADAIRKTGEAIQDKGGMEAMNLKVAEQYVAAFSNLAKTNNTLIVPSTMSDMSGMIASALAIAKPVTTAKS